MGILKDLHAEWSKTKKEYSKDLKGVKFKMDLGPSLDAIDELLGVEGKEKAFMAAAVKLKAALVGYTAAIKNVENAKARKALDAVLDKIEFAVKN